MKNSGYLNPNNSNNSILNSNLKNNIPNSEIIYENYNKSIVNILDKNNNSIWTGFLISEEYILTNKHVLFNENINININILDNKNQVIIHLDKLLS